MMESERKFCGNGGWSLERLQKAKKKHSWGVKRGVT